MKCEFCNMIAPDWIQVEEGYRVLAFCDWYCLLNWINEQFEYGALE